MWSVFHELWDERDATRPARRSVLQRATLATGVTALAGFDLLWPRRTVTAADANGSDPKWGTIKGRVVWGSEDAPPERQAIDLAKFSLQEADRAFFASQGPILSHDWVVRPDDKGVRYVFVWLMPSGLGADETLAVHPNLDKPGPAREIDQPCSGFTPHAIALREGQELIVRNDSPIHHAVAFNGPPGTPEINKAMAPATKFSVTDLKALKYPIKVLCAPHPWEGAWLRIFSHPYFAVTDEHGAFEIPFAPAGPHRLVIWHETAGWRGGAAGRHGQEIKIEGAATVDLGEITLKPRAT